MVLEMGGCFTHLLEPCHAEKKTCPKSSPRLNCKDASAFRFPCLFLRLQDVAAVCRRAQKQTTNPFLFYVFLSNYAPTHTLIHTHTHTRSVATCDKTYLSVDDEAATIIHNERAD